MKRAIVYTTDNHLPEKMLWIIRDNIRKASKGIPIVTVSQYPIPFGDVRIVVGELGRNKISYYTQWVRGLEACDAEVVNLVEHDVIYHPSHFDYVPETDDEFHYNYNLYFLDAATGVGCHYDTTGVSLLVASRVLLLHHYRERLEMAKQGNLPRRAGHEPGHHTASKGGVGEHGFKRFMSKWPCIDIRHGMNYSPGNRFDIESFRNRPKNYQLVDEIPYWGKTKGRFDRFLNSLPNRDII